MSGARRRALCRERPATALPGRLHEDRGSAVVEFPLVGVLIVLIAITIIQCAVIVHARNTLLDSAIQGAHEAALVGNDPQDGARRARELVAERLGEAYDISAAADQSGQGRITVRISATLPLIGMLGPSDTLTVQGHAIDEETL